MVNCKINNTSFAIPSNWDELSNEQLKSIVSQFYSGANEAQLKLKALLTILKARVLIKNPVLHEQQILHKIKLGRQKAWLSDVQLKAMTDKLSFLTAKYETETGAPAYTLDSSLTVNLFDQFRHKRNMYYGPEEKLFNITFGEYITAETNYLRYIKTKNNQDLDKLVATLYRRQLKSYKPNALTNTGDRREPFNDHLVNGRAAKLKKLDNIIKIGILLYYQGCRKFISNQFPDVFKKSTSGFTSTVPGMLGLVDALTGEDVTKTEEVRSSMLYDVLIRLQKAAERHEQTKQEIAKQKQK